MNRLDRSPSSGNHDKSTDSEENHVHRHQAPPSLGSQTVPVVPNPHVRFHLDTDDRGEKGSDEGQQVVEEWNRFGNDKADSAGEEDTRAGMSL